LPYVKVLIRTDPLSQFRLDGEVAVVTGGASGIGRTIADAFAGVGARVAIFDRVAGGPGDYKVDVSDESHGEGRVRRSDERHGRIDVLFNNAGIALRATDHRALARDWNKVVAVNMTGVFLCAREAARHMLVADAAGGSSTPPRSWHLGRRALSEHLVPGDEGRGREHDARAGRRVARQGIRVNAIAPTGCARR